MIDGTDKAALAIAPTNKNVNITEEVEEIKGYSKIWTYR
jgi:hypothetical protein